MPEEEKKEMSNRRANETAPSDRTPQVYAVRKGRSGWTLNRRGLLAAAASAAAITGAARAQCHEKGYSTKNSILDLAISPDGRILASAELGVVSLWSLPEGALLKDLSFGSYDSVRAVAISPDGRLLAAGNVKGEIRLWSLPDGELLRVISAYPGSSDYGVTALGLGPEGVMVSAGGGDAWAYARRKVQLWSVPDGVLLRTLTERHRYGVGVSPDGRRFAFAEDESFKIQVWSIGGDLEATLTGVQEPPDVIAISADGKLLACGPAFPPGGARVKLWSVPDKTFIDLPVQAMSVSALRISPDGRWLAANVVCPGPAPTPPCFPDGISLWSLPDGRLHRTTALAEQTYPLAIAPHGEWLAEGFYHIRLWTLPDGKLLPACFTKKEASYPEAKLVEYTRDGTNYSLPCGSPLPTGAVCTCNCVAGTRSDGCGGYWYPN